jgi:hypothetical protein
MNESFTKSKYGHLLFAFLFVFVGLIECYGLVNFGSPWHVVARDFQTFFKNETDETFDDTRWVLTMTRVAPECRDTTGASHLCRGTS